MGYFWGFVGVLIFSFTLPATRLTSGFLDPIFVGLGRSAIAGIVGLCALVLTRSPIPPPHILFRISIVALGVVFGFPLFTSFAMQGLPASHGAVVVGLVPLATAVAAAFIARERHAVIFWIASIAGSMCIVFYALYKSNWYLGIQDINLFLAVIFVAVGYAEGARLSREYGGWRIISWALVVSLPLSLIAFFGFLPTIPMAVPMHAWIGFAYLSIFSMYLGFVAWYHGLSKSGIGNVGQIQLLQTFFTLFFSWIVLAEPFDIGTAIIAVLVVGFVFLGRRQKTAVPH